MPIPDQGENETPRGPLVTPGSYVIQLEAGGSVAERTMEVREDPRIQVETGGSREMDGGPPGVGGPFPGCCGRRSEYAGAGPSHRVLHHRI